MSRAIRVAARAIRCWNIRRNSVRFAAVATVLAGAALTGVGVGSPPASAAATYVFSLTKTASVTSYSSAGTVITYSYLVTNNGSGSLANVTVTDPLPGLSPINCGGNSNVIPSLAPFASVTCTATYTVTQANMDSGSIFNSAEAVADTPVGETKVETDLTIPADQVPQLQIVKSANVQGFTHAGTTITYSFTVTNTGNVTLAPVVVTDPLPGLSSINCGSNTNVIPSLAPGQSVTCTATYVTTATDVHNGHVNNTATATGTSPTDTRVSSTSQDVVPVQGQPFSCTNPGAYLSQSNSSLIPPAAAIQLYYSQVFFNSYTFPTLGTPRTPTYNALGYDPINNYLYSSQVYPSADELLRIDASGNYTVAGAVTPLSGSFNWTTNGPDVGAFDSSGDYWFTQSNRTTAWEIPAANFVAGPPYKAVPWALKARYQPADWTFTPSTTSGINGYLWGLHQGLIYRVELLSSGALPVASFAAPATIPTGTSAGADWTYGNNNVGFDSNQTGGVYQVAIANPSGTPVFTGYPSYVGPVAGTINDGAACAGKPADLGIVKTGPATVPANGTVTWTLKVTNYGPGNSSGFTVTDPIPAGIVGASTPTPGCAVASGALTCSEGILDVGNSFTIILTGTLPSGCATNTATVTGNELDPNEKNNTSSVVTCVGPTLTLNKSANVTSVSATGVTITYSYTVTNTGPYMLYNVTVTDPMAGLSAINCGGNSNVIPSLAPSASVTCTATYTTTLADLNAGEIQNTGTASVLTPAGELTASSSVVVPAEQEPGVQIVKSANVDDFTQVGQVITYSFVVTNTGNVTLTNVTVTDPLAGLSSINCGSNTNVIPSLAPGQSVTCTATYTVTSSTLSMKYLVNTATVTGSSPSDATVSSASTVTVTNDAKSKPWDCQLTNSTDFLSQGTSSAGPPTSPTQLYGTTSNIWTYATIGPTAVPTYNALGFDTTNDYLYATDVAPTSPAKFIQIGSGGVVVSSRSIGPPYVVKSGPDVGAFDPSGNYWFTTSGTGTAWRIPAAQVAAGAIVPVPTTETHLVFRPADWSWVDGAFWGAYGSELYKMTTAGAVSAYPAPSQLAAVGSANPVFGAAWTFGNGDLGVSNNKTGKIFMIRITGSTPTISWVTTFPGPVTASVNDGSSCIGLAVDLGIKKSGPSLVLPGGLISWTLKVTNYGPGNSSGWVVDDPFPAGVTGVSSTSPGCTVLATEVQCQGNVLNVGQSVSVTITARAPTGQGECVVNGATVTGADRDPVASNNSSSVRTCTNNWIHITKTSPLSNFAVAGTEVPFSFVVSDVAPKSASGAVEASESLHDVTVVDTLAGVSEVRCGKGNNVIAALAPGQSVSCAATLLVTPSEASAGQIVNVAYATGYDGTGQFLTSASSKVVVVRGVHVVTTSLANATQGTAYKAKLAASGGATPYRWSAVGKLPDGLTLSSAGLLSGTPKGSGTFALTFRVSSAATKAQASGSASVTLYLTIVPRK